jgi:hypothetical protein
MDLIRLKQQERWRKRQMRLLRPKKLHLKKTQARALWEFRLSQRTPAERKRMIKYARRMERYAKRGQLRTGLFYCKAGRLINQARVDRYEPMCHFMVRKFLPALALWEGAMDYADLVNQCKIEVFLALLNGFDPHRFLKPRERTQEELDTEIQKMEQGIVFGRLENYLRRTVWKNHPDQLGGLTWSLDRLLSTGSRTGTGGQRGPVSPGGIERSRSEEFKFGLYSEMNLDFLDFVQEQTDRLLEILEVNGPDAAKSAFLELDSEKQRLIGDSLFSRKPSCFLEGEEECVSE